ncbi:MAG: hypothetical protein Pg6B_02440 [Candidatus Azobacteroides pseudotrichonymphae]|nr:MAG: hypothetical protein Pg6B_02440 [Candidatus Azobacteroides pseudotrichonymphae]
MKVVDISKVAMVNRSNLPFGDYFVPIVFPWGKLFRIRLNICLDKGQWGVQAT